MSTLFMFGKLGCAATLPSVTAMAQPAGPCQVNYAMDAAEISGVVVIKEGSDCGPVTDTVRSGLPEAVWPWTSHHGSSLISRTNRRNLFV